MTKEIKIKEGDIKNQYTCVLWHLRNYKKITSLDAIRDYGITRLASIINIARNEGYNIKTNLVKGKNRFGNSFTIAEYEYVSK